MEGAAFMYACLIHEVVFAQVRAVSNVVERRNRDAWKMAEAIGSLGAHRAQHPGSRYEPVPRLFSLPERLLHVRRDREPADRSGRAGVLGSHGGRGSAEQGGVRGRSRRHQAELSRVCALHRQLRAARRRQRSRQELRTAAHFQAADLEGRSGGRSGQDRHSRKIHDRQFPARPCVSLGARQDRAGVLRHRAGAAERANTTPG